MSNRPPSSPRNGPSTGPATTIPLSGLAPASLDGRPLYAQIREILRERIRNGDWKPGEQIPNEHRIAAELGVSQGTMRKALAALAAEGLLVRQQGRGTSVVRHTAEDVLFRFLALYDDNGEKLIPDSRVLRVTTAPASKPERLRLALAEGEQVYRIERIRLTQDVPIIHERIVLPAGLFPGLLSEEGVPNTLYDLFQRRYGILVARADEEIRAVAASATAARHLNIAAGVPLLAIDRIARGLDETALEWRVSTCHLPHGHYRSVLD